jgi:predicted transcriptional regulator
MDDNAPGTNPILAELTAGVVSAYVSNNSVQASDLAGLIASIYTSLSGVGLTSPDEADKPVPRVPKNKSITPDYIISLEDGQRYKTLKRHLSGRGMTPDEYRSKWGLPKDYPMVASNYAAKRSELAKALGLGQQRRKRAETTEADTAPKGKRGRPRKNTAA